MDEGTPEKKCGIWNIILRKDGEITIIPESCISVFSSTFFSAPFT